MAPSPEVLGTAPAPAGKKRALVIALVAVALLAAVFVVAKVVMPHTAPSNPIAAVTSAPAKARAAAAASNAASAKLNAATGASETSTTLAPAVSGATPKAGVAGVLTGPVPNTTRDPFLP